MGVSFLLMACYNTFRGAHLQEESGRKSENEGKEKACKG